MTRAAIFKDWRDLDLFRQTPGGRGVWDAIQFAEDPPGELDYAAVLNRPERDVWVRCPPHHLWAVIQEPPNETFDFLHYGDAAYARVYTSDDRLRGEEN